MPSNTVLNSGSGGDTVTTKQRTHDGDTTKQQMVSLSGVTGTEDAYTFTDVQAGEGTEANAIRVTVGTDSDLVVNSNTLAGAVHNEDSAHTSGDAGVQILAVRQDTQVDFGADGDYVPLSIDGDGALRVNAINADGTSAVDSAAGGTDTGAVMLAVRDDSLTTLTPVDGDYTQLRVNSTGALHVTGGGGGTEYNEDDATPATIVGTASLMERDDALATLTPAEGDFAAFRCSAEGALWTQDFNSDAILADTTTLAGAVSGSEMQVDVVAALPAGTNNIGDVDLASSIPAGTNNIGDVDIDSIAAGSNLIGDVGIGVRTSGGTTLYKNIDVDESEDQIKGTAGQVYWIHAINLNAAVRYLKFYNATSASVTVGTTVPDLTFPVPASTTGAGFVLSIPNGIAFGTAITVAATTGVADNDSGAPGANEIILNLGYA